MRAKINGIITTAEAKELLSLQFVHNGQNKGFNQSIVKKVIEKCSKYIGKCKLKAPSYWNIENRHSAHEWHLDTGSNNHMPWCDYGISILLTPPHDAAGGLFKYREPDLEYKQSEHYLNAIIHSSDEWHMREESDNGRTVLLIFLSKEDE